NVEMREQYWDFMRGTAFRKTLLCRHDVELHPQSAASIKDYYLTTDVTAQSGDIDPTSDDVVEFTSANGDNLRTGHRAAKAAFVVLGRAWRRQLSWPQLIEAAGALLTEHGGRIDSAEMNSLPDA